MPVLNEQKYLATTVDAILKQNYPGKLSIILALGPSTDNTNVIAHQVAADNPNVLLVESPTGRTAESLNLAIAKSTEKVIVRVDAHAELSSGYIQMAIETLQRTGADNVGGIMWAKGVTKFEKAVASAMTSPLGVGNAAFHTGGNEGPAETVYLGVFKRSALERVGGYDPKFTRAQDWELNHRIRQAGGLVWFNPKLKVAYRPRSNVKSLAKQYFEYGTWRREVMRSHPESTKRKSALRYFVPPLTFLGFTIGLLLGLLGIALKSNLIFAGLLPAVYLVFTLFSTVVLFNKSHSASLYLPIVLPTMQLSWGCGFLFGKYLASIKK